MIGPVAAQEIEIGDHGAAGAAAEAHAHAHGDEAGTEMHTFIGVALVLGFIFMLLVDQLGGNTHHHSPTGECGWGMEDS